MNYIDLIIIVVLLFYAIEGLSAGFLLSILDLGSFIASFLIGLTFYSFFGNILVSAFAIPAGFSNAIGFFIAAFFAEILINLILKSNAGSFIPKINLSAGMDKILGGLASVSSGLVLVSFIATLIISLPLS